jgi:hypothetical protein
MQEQMNFVNRLNTFSKRFYSIILAFAIPFYLLLYGAIGHRFDPTIEDVVWMIIIVFAFVMMMLYLTLRKTDGLGSKAIRVILGVTLLGTAYGAARILLTMIQFEFDEEVSFIIRGLFYLLPIIFLFSIAVIFIGLFKNKKPSSSNSRNGLHTDV